MRISDWSSDVCSSDLSHIRAFGTPLVIHSTPLWLLPETGIVGFLIFAVPAVRVFFVEARRTERDSASVFLVLIITALAVMSLAHELLYQRAFWFLFGAALADRKSTRLNSSQ